MWFTLLDRLLVILITPQMVLTNNNLARCVACTFGNAASLMSKYHELCRNRQKNKSMMLSDGPSRSISNYMAV